jgi:transposase-like protein
MKRIRRNHGAAFKVQVAMAAMKEDRTIAELASEYKIHPNQISKWKKHFQENAESLFTDRSNKENEETVARLYEEIGRLKVELDYLKKKL